VRPFVRILIFFVIGILITRYIPTINNINIQVYLIASLILFLVAFFLTLTTIKHKLTWITGLAFGILITITAILITSEKTYKITSNSIDSEYHSYLGNIISNPTETNQAVKVIVMVTPAKPDSIQNITQKKVLYYFSKDSLSMSLEYGDVITVNSKLTIPGEPLNPEEFNYSEYLKHIGIYYTSFVNSSSWKLIGYNPKNPIIAIAGKLRSQILDILSQNGLSGDNYSVAAAILLGYDDTMENNLKQDYIMAGAMHILCVSGLHVGIIYLVISFFLGFLNNTRFNNILKAILLLLTVWAYAIITGLSPSVQRASLMLSVFIIGNLLNRARDTYNTLAISALILLIIDPYLLFNVGFQLSYAAVIGIVTFHQPIYKLLYFKNTIIDKIWSITVLSFAAQMATFPIATYYFHFFPPWFWLTNLFTFPLSFIIIATGLLFVVTLWIPIVPQVVGWLLSGMIYLLNLVVGTVKFLPFSGISNIYTSMPMVIFIYLLLLLMFVMVNKKKLQLLIPVTLIIAVIFVIHTYHNYDTLHQKKIVIYSINKHSAWDFIVGNNHVLITDSLLTNDKSKIDYHLKNSRSRWRTDDILQTLPKNDTTINRLLSLVDNFLFFNDVRIYINDGEKQFYPVKSKLHLDIILMSGERCSDIAQLQTIFEFDRIIIDSSVPWWQQKKIMEVAEKQNINCYNVNTQGAIVIDL
jgi:competence protein ComEC